MKRLLKIRSGYRVSLWDKYRGCCNFVLLPSIAIGYSTGNFVSLFNDDTCDSISLSFDWLILYAWIDIQFNFRRE